MNQLKATESPGKKGSNHRILNGLGCNFRSPYVKGVQFLLYVYVKGVPFW